MSVAEYQGGASEATPDTGYPNYLVVFADGTIGAVFPGGIVLPAVITGNTPTIDKKLTWTQTGDAGSPVVAQIIGQRDLGVTDDAQLRLIANHPTLGSAELDVFTSSAGFPGVTAAITAVLKNGAGTTLASAQLIDANNASDFLRVHNDLGLPTTSSSGRTLVTWPGAVTQVVQTIFHGLNDVAAHGIAAMRLVTGDIANTCYCSLEPFGADTNNFVLRTVSPLGAPGAGQTCHVDWIAWRST